MESIYNVLVSNIYNKGLTESLMKEDATLKKKREDLTRVLALLDKAQGTHLSETLEQELRQRDSGGGKTNRRVNGAVERQRQATRQAVRPR